MEVQVLSRPPRFMKHHVIYVPGITDDILHVQSMLIRSWLLYGLRPHTHAVPWAGEDSFEPKLQQLVGLIDALSAAGHTVSLVGASAGASAVLHAYSMRKDKVTGLVYICGKINRPEAVSERTYTQNPAFKGALFGLPDVLQHLTPQDKEKMMSFYSRVDTTVPYPDTLISGVQEQQLPSVKHGWAIVYAISFGAYRIARFLKARRKQV